MQKLDITQLKNERFTLEELKAMATIRSTHDADLKIEDKEQGFRVWLSRLSVRDGAEYDNKVEIEVQSEYGDWISIQEYQAL